MQQPLSSRILDATAAHYGISRRAMLSKVRVRKAVVARMVALHLIEELLNGGREQRRLSTTWMGNLLNRDRATVRHALRCMQERLPRDPKLARAVAKIRAAVEGGTDEVRDDRAGAGDAAPG